MINGEWLMALILLCKVSIVFKNLSFTTNNQQPTTNKCMVGGLLFVAGT